MTWLLLVSVVWGLSFGLVKTGFAGIDSQLLAVLRLMCAALVFLPIASRAPTLRLRCGLMAIGGIQYGLMYVCLFAAFQHLPAWSVALNTVLTPFHVVLIDAVWRRDFRLTAFIAALVAVAGGWVLRASGGDGWHWQGVLLVQSSNLCFAFGQVAWQRVWAQQPEAVAQQRVFIWPLAGGITVAALATTVSAGWSDLLRLDFSHWITLLYLGVVASGLCFFWWNLGATRVSTTQLAIFNNLKIPVAIVLAITLFGESANIPSLLTGVALLAGAWWIETKTRTPVDS
jgi:drug/metabolite transporter (DMT)-like permease